MKAIESKILVVKENQQDTKLTEKLGGFEVPMGAGEYETYKVVSVGEKIDSLKEGDVIFTYQNPGHRLTYQGIEYKVISVTDVLAVL